MATTITFKFSNNDTLRFDGRTETEARSAEDWIANAQPHEIYAIQTADEKQTHFIQKAHVVDLILATD